MADLTLRIDRIHEEIRPTPGGDLVAMRVVTYFVGKQGPYQKRYPQEGFDPAAVRTDLEAEADKLRALLG